MNQMNKQITEMKSTPSTGIDNISLKTIKQVLPVIKDCKVRIDCESFPRDMLHARMTIVGLFQLLISP